MTLSTMAWALGPGGTLWVISTIFRIRCCLKATMSFFTALIQTRKTSSSCSFPMGFEAFLLKIEPDYYQNSMHTFINHNSKRLRLIRARLLVGFGCLSSTWALAQSAPG